MTTLSTPERQSVRKPGADSPDQSGTVPVTHSGEWYDEERNEPSETPDAPFPQPQGDGTLFHPENNQGTRGSYRTFFSPKPRHIFRVSKSHASDRNSVTPQMVMRVATA